MKRNILLSSFIISLCGCSQVTTYSFKDITFQDINTIDKVMVNNPKSNEIYVYEGDYKQILDIDYILSNISYNESKNIYDKYQYKLSINDNFDFYIYESKMYYFSNTSLFESKDKVNYEFTNEEIKTLDLKVSYDYETYIKNKATPLLNGSLIWFDLKEYEINSIAAEDVLLISYTGEFIVNEVYPSIVEQNKINIKSIELTETTILEGVIKEENGDKVISLPY